MGVFKKVARVYLRPRTLTDNAYTESFNGSLRDECLNTDCISLEGVQDKIEHWETAITFVWQRTNIELARNQGLCPSRSLDFSHYPWTTFR